MVQDNFIDTEEDFDLDDEVIYQDWQLLCPPHGDPHPISLAELRLFELVSRKLSLVLTRDDKRRRLYLSNGLAAEPEPEEEDDDEDEEPSTGRLRYPSGWQAEVFDERVAGSEYQAIDPVAAAPLVKAFPDAQLSEHFQLSEFRPGEHSYNYIRISPSLIQTLETIRKKAGKPVEVTSGYRPVAYNRKVGGVSNSTHIDGLAADIYVDGMSTEALHAICDGVIGDRGGVGYYPTLEFVHIDLRGYRARWTG